MAADRGGYPPDGWHAAFARVHNVAAEAAFLRAAAGTSLISAELAEMIAGAASRAEAQAARDGAMLVPCASGCGAEILAPCTDPGGEESASPCEGRVRRARIRGVFPEKMAVVVARES